MKDAARLKILLTDDDLDDCYLFEEALKSLNLPGTFRALHNGEQLMRYLNEADELPTVLFLDLNMPRKNGFTCLEEIKRNEKLKVIPVIIFSTSYDESIANVLYKNGAHHYICKPGSFSDLKKLIAHSLELISKEKTIQPPKENFLLSNILAVLL